jgi:hypothetical protein
MAYVDTVYNQFIFDEMADNQMEAGKPYMIVVNRGEIQFDAVEAKLTNKVADGIPVYDFTEWWWYDRKSEIGTWNGSFEAVWSGNNDYFLSDNGTWESLGFRSQFINPFRAFLRANGSLTEYWYLQNPNMAINEVAPTNAARSFATRFFQQDDEGNGEVTEKQGLHYVGDIHGNGTTGIAPTITTIDRDGTQQFFDLQGHRLNGKLQKGVYIINGKKILR